MEFALQTQGSSSLATQGFTIVPPWGRSSEPVLIEKHDHPTAVILSIAEYDRLKLLSEGVYGTAVQPPPNCPRRISEPLKRMLKRKTFFVRHVISPVSGSKDSGTSIRFKFTAAW